MHQSPLFDLLAEAGGIAADYHGRQLMRHFGDPAGEYVAATEGVAVIDRSHRARMTVSGRAPIQMLSGVLTGRMPAVPTTDHDLAVGAATYHAVLTPKGKMVSDLWALLPGTEEDPGVVLDVPVAGAQPLVETFAKVLPPRFARLTDVSESTGMISLIGPDAAKLVSELALGLAAEPSELIEAPEGRWWRRGEPLAGLTVMRGGDVWPPSFTLLGETDAVAALWSRAVEAGAVPAGLGVWSTLRVEAGRPVFGTDMDDRTIPVEAGIHDRAIDHSKGCYTGQEVIVRIRDRGHVNRHLRRLVLGDVPTPPKGTPLFSPEDPSKQVGEVTSAVQSPREGAVIALAYVRREMGTVTLDGAEITVPTDAAGSS